MRLGGLEFPTKSAGSCWFHVGCAWSTEPGFFTELCTLMLFISAIEAWPRQIWGSHQLSGSVTENGLVCASSYASKISLKSMVCFLSWFKLVQVW